MGMSGCAALPRQTLVLSATTRRQVSGLYTTQQLTPLQVDLIHPCPQHAPLPRAAAQLAPCAPAAACLESAARPHSTLCGPPACPWLLRPAVLAGAAGHRHTRSTWNVAWGRRLVDGCSSETASFCLLTDLQSPMQQEEHRLMACQEPLCSWHGKPGHIHLTGWAMMLRVSTLIVSVCLSYDRWCT